MQRLPALLCAALLPVLLFAAASRSSLCSSLPLFSVQRLPALLCAAASRSSLCIAAPRSWLGIAASRSFVFFVLSLSLSLSPSVALQLLKVKSGVHARGAMTTAFAQLSARIGAARLALTEARFQDEFSRRTQIDAIANLLRARAKSLDFEQRAMILENLDALPLTENLLHDLRIVFHMEIHGSDEPPKKAWEMQDFTNLIYLCTKEDWGKMSGEPYDVRVRVVFSRALKLNCQRPSETTMKRWTAWMLLMEKS